MDDGSGSNMGVARRPVNGPAAAEYLMGGGSGCFRQESLREVLTREVTESHNINLS